MSTANARSVRVRVPATSANLGPGFDCLGLALDLWNETIFTLEGSGLSMHSTGEGCDIPLDEHNLLLRGMRLFCQQYDFALPGNVSIRCHNHIPVGSGLGSSAAAALTGILGAAALLGQTPEKQALLDLCAQMEGHADNAAAAIFGGLVVVSRNSRDGWLAQQIETPTLRVALALPEVNLPTSAARAALPEKISIEDASFNLGRVVMLAEALRAGDLPRLAQVMDDRLHLPYRLPLIPGGAAAMQAAVQAGASAVTISGAGPSLIAFTSQPEAAVKAMITTFDAHGISARGFALKTSRTGAQVETHENNAAWA